jgi:hypothetical protein
MYEAIRFAEELTELLNRYRFRDRGAHIRVIVHDTAGNCAQIEAEGGVWTMDEGFDVPETLLRSPAMNDPAMLNKTVRQLIDEHVESLSRPRAK